MRRGYNCVVAVIEMKEVSFSCIYFFRFWCDIYIKFIK